MLERDFWREGCPPAFAVDRVEELSGSVVSFFHLCQAAELGSMTIGKRGQPARLHIWRNALALTLEHR